MSNRTYSTGICGHRIYFDPVVCYLDEWWCPTCSRTYKFTSQEKELVLVAYKHGRQEMKTEILNELKVI